jgi:hypothetical protein
MIDHRCRDCIWWDNVHISVQSIPITEEKPRPGYCRKKRPNIILFQEHHFGAQPVMDANEFCGEFKGE